jgi:NAD(P)H-hydrate epimerase
MTSATNQTTLTRQQVREVDRRAIEDFAIPGVVLMENAGRGAADIVRQAFESESRQKSDGSFVAIVCGRGNNGGDGFVIARHLSNGGTAVELFLACDPARLAGDAATNFTIAQRMGLRCHPFDTVDRIAAAAHRLGEAVVVVDAVLGTGFAGDVRSPFDGVIDAINQVEDATVIAIDVPSGLDCDTGKPSNATVRADATVTFVAAKAGFADSVAYTGRVHVVDIGAPAEIIQAVLSDDSSG